MSDRFERKRKIGVISGSAENLVADALRKFRERMNSAFPLARLQEFHSEAELKEVATAERKKVFDQFIPVIMTFDAQKMGSSVTELEIGIQKITHDVTDVNKSHKERIEAFFENIVNHLGEDYRKSVEKKLSANRGTTMDVDHIERVLQNEKTLILGFFSDLCQQLGWQEPQTLISKLEAIISRLQKTFEEKYMRTVQPQPVQNAASALMNSLDRKKLDNLKEVVLKICDELEILRHIKRQRENYDMNWFRRRINQVDFLLATNANFFHDENKEIRANLQVVVNWAKMAVMCMRCSLQTNTNEASFVACPKNGYIFAKAFEIDLSNCFPCQRETPRLQEKRLYLQLDLFRTIHHAKVTQFREEEVPPPGTTREALLANREMSVDIAVKVVMAKSEPFTKRLYCLLKSKSLDEVNSNDSAREEPSVFVRAHSELNVNEIDMM